ncbi:MAG: polyhydroxyalkanoate depolymerase, partial [Phycisphaerales bacterium]|nr:polyhydroxyalkanoate depolymerase [Phycisphaerales bacterium]
MITALLSAVLTLHSFTALATSQRTQDNRAQLDRAIELAPVDQKDAMRWLVAHMPASDAQTLSSEFLLDECAQAHEAWRTAPWHAQVSQELFLDCILPYANISESRDPWRSTLREICLPLIASAKTPSEATAVINRELFTRIGVKYSTLRKKADQSPRESIESGLASCTGLAILLVDACRSVGIPARFAGIPMWNDGSGNHSWVEIWDNGWHFTGAAEATGNDLDKGWFTDRTAQARRDEAPHAIYAVTWRESPTLFPVGWTTQDEEIVVRAVNVTDRYATASETLAPGQARVRIRAVAGDERVAIPVTITNARGETLFTGTTRDEGFDANDHLTATLPLGSTVSATAAGLSPLSFTVERDEQLVTATVSASASQQALKELRLFLGKQGVKDIGEQPFALVALSRDDAIKSRDLIWKSYSSRLRAERKRELTAGVIDLNGAVMPIWFKAYGDKPKSGHSLFISMHGGGGAPPEVNTQQWENQKRLYEPKEGIYVAPRAPTDTWNLWHQAHIDPLFTRLIEDMIIVEGIDPNRVYIMGYSAGGDGVYQLAPRMADQLAAAAMMAGHPNETKPDSLRNLPFALHV